MPRDDLNLDGLAFELPLLWGVIREVVAEVRRATEKHGAESMAGPGHSVGKRLGILAEEVGEAADEALAVAINATALSASLGRVARRTTYDNGDSVRLRDELIQTAAMAVAWVYSMDAE